MKSFSQISETFLYTLCMVLICSCNNSSDSQSQARDSSSVNHVDKAERPSEAKFTRLRDIIRERKLNFTVGKTSVTGLSIPSITGEKELTPSQNDSIRTLLNRLENAKGNKDKAERYLVVNGKSLSPSMSSLDLREYGLVTPVKDQGAAGSCWSFGSMAAYESSYEAINAKLIDASEQYVINCSGAGTANDGGLAFEVFKWMVEGPRNVDDERTTRYIARDSACNPTKPRTNYFATEWRLIDPNLNPDAIPTMAQIKDAMCRYGVISASVYVDDAFQNYTGGIFKAVGTYSGTNHAISLVGWDDSKGCWILKNSWGKQTSTSPGWGETCGFGTENGYMWIDYNANNIGRRAAWVKAKRSK